MGHRQIHVGLDLGKSHDPSAYAVVDVQDIQATPEEPEHTLYRVQDIKRLLLQTSYPVVAGHMVKVLRALYTMTLDHVGQFTIDVPELSVHLYVDATGVGTPVVDILREALAHDSLTRDVVLHPLTFVHGELYNRHTGRLGKAYLVSRLMSLLQQEHLKLPKNHPEAQATVEELKVYDIHVDQDGHDTYGAFKTGTHDDLVTALGLACLDDPRTYRVTMGPKIF